MSKRRATAAADPIAKLHDLIRRCDELRESDRPPATRKLVNQVQKLQKALEDMSVAMRRKR